MASRTLSIEFIGDSKPLQDAMGKVEDSAGKLHAKVSGLSSGFGDVAKTAAGFLSANIIGSAPGFLMDAAKAASEDEAESARLGATIRSLGGDFDAQMKQVDAAIASGQKLGFSDGEIRDSFDKLAQATGNSEEALTRQKLAMDLARGANIPLADASKLLGKVTDENLQVFKKMGITLPDVASEADVLAAVQGKFAGQSEAYANSTAGQFAQLKIRMEEAKETIGYALIPIMATLGTVLATQIVPAIEDFANKVGPVLSASFNGLQSAFDAIQPYWAPIAAGIGAVAAVILGSMIPAGIAWIAVEWAKVAAFTASAAAFLLANAPLIAIAVGIGLVVAAVVLLVQHWDEITAKFPILGQAADAVKATFEAFAGWITGSFVPVVVSIGTAVADAAGVAIGFIRDHWGEIQAVIEPIMLAVKVYITTIFDGIKLYIETWFGIFKGLFDVFAGLFTGDWQRMWDGVKQIVQTVWDAITGVFTIAFDAINTLTGGRLGEVLATVTEKLSTIEDKFTTVFDSISSTVGSVLGTIAGAFQTFFDTAVGPIQWIIDRIYNLIEAIGKIPSPGDVLGGAYDNTLGRLGFASGTLSAPGGLAILGEQGPELAMIPRGTRIFPANETRRLLSSAAGGGVTVNMYGDVYARDQADAQQAGGDIGFAALMAMRARGVA